MDAAGRRIAAMLLTLPLARAPVAQELEAAGATPAGELFARHCALCHGEQGRGDGPAAELLFPPPRDFGTGRFRIVSTRNGVPTEQDLLSVLRRGMPGSAMPSFHWMEDATLRSLAGHVRELAVGGVAEELFRDARTAGTAIEREEARVIAERRLRPGRAIELPPPPAETEATRERGAVLFGEHCASCHGEDGRGKVPEGLPELLGDEPRFRWPRDFTAGVLKGGAGFEDLALRVIAGMPGSTMEPTTIGSAEDVAAVVRHAMELIPPGAAERLVQRRCRAIAARIDGELPSDPAAGAWELHGRPVTVALAPMWWNEAAVVGATVTALHDGESIALRVQWHDATRDDRAFHDSPSSDGVALQFSAAAEPPMFGMGMAGRPVNIWHWKAFRLRDVEGLLDLLERPPHAGAVPDVPFYVPAPGVAEPRREGESVPAEGFHSVPDFEAKGVVIRAFPRWHDGVWSVVFTRPLAARAEAEIELSPGASVQMALAIWNGSLRQQAARKSITIWHQLVLER